ncbi:major Facilitator Superfamily protein [bacterium BMS3Abin02]|nr:major Facilitator Superfamily protein [bacterium BMS3Abin02]GBE21855.1 major Facilitator Superfamily protein [bacterium BMS3Bbin01]
MLPTRTIRRRLIGTLFAGSGINRIGFLLALTVASLAAQDMLGSALWAGLPAAVGVAGMALATTPMSAYMARRGRRAGMVAGQTIAVAGALVAAVAVYTGLFLVLIVGFFLFGAGNSSDRLARYAAAEVVSPERRGSAIALVVWAGTVGSVIGPSLLEPAQRFGIAVGVTGLAGPYLGTAIAFALAGILIAVLLRPDPLEFAAEEQAKADSVPMRVSALLRIPKFRFAIVALVAGQVVMVLIMTMTPIYIRSAGQSLGIVGLVISAHTLGMFALSPITGWLADRLGRIQVVLGGDALLLIAGVLAAFAAGSDRVLLVGSLFLLGLGWNFGFVAGSALVIEDVAPGARLRAQGVADAFVWMSGAVATVASGFLLAAGGYAALSLVGAALALVPPLVLVRMRRAAASVQPVA